MGGGACGRAGGGRGMWGGPDDGGGRRGGGCEEGRRSTRVSLPADTVTVVISRNSFVKFVGIFVH